MSTVLAKPTRVIQELTASQQILRGIRRIEEQNAAAHKRLDADALERIKALVAEIGGAETHAEAAGPTEA
jgi:hypothetical protein